MPRFPLRVLTFVDRGEKADIEYHYLLGHNRVSNPGRPKSPRSLEMLRYSYFLDHVTLSYMLTHLEVVECCSNGYYNQLYYGFDNHILYENDGALC